MQFEVKDKFIFRDMIRIKISPFNVEASSQTGLFHDMYPGSKDFEVTDLFDICPHNKWHRSRTIYENPEQLLEELDKWKQNWIRYLNSVSVCPIKNVEPIYNYLQKKIKTKMEQVRSKQNSSSEKSTAAVKILLQIFFLLLPRSCIM